MLLCARTSAEGTGQAFKLGLASSSEDVLEEGKGQAFDFGFVSSSEVPHESS